MSVVRTSYTDAEILAFPNMTWQEYEAQRGRGSGPRRIERGPRTVKPSAPRDYFSEPIDFLALPLHILTKKEI
jgi:hypothetical protein